MTVVRLRRWRTGEAIELALDSRLPAGGEARLLAVAGRPELVAKIYRAAPDEPRARKLGAMVEGQGRAPNAPGTHPAVAWPIDVLCAAQSRAVGVLLPRITGAVRLDACSHPATRKRLLPFWSYAHLVGTARNLAAAVEAVHARGHVIGDITPANALVLPDGRVTLVDTDSYQIRDLRTGETFPCPVGTDGYLAPREQRLLTAGTLGALTRTPQDDLYGLAVLVWQLLMLGSHPFQARYIGRGDDPLPLPADRIAAEVRLPYDRSTPGPYVPARGALPLQLLHPEVAALLVTTFVEGASDPSRRATAAELRRALDTMGGSLVTCGRNPQHRYPGHLRRCCWCMARERHPRRVDPFPVRAAARGAGQAAPPKSPPQAPNGTTRPAPAGMAALVQRCTRNVFGPLTRARRALSCGARLTRGPVGQMLASCGSRRGVVASMICVAALAVAIGLAHAATRRALTRRAAELAWNVGLPTGLAARLGSSAGVRRGRAALVAGDSAAAWREFRAAALARADDADAWMGLSALRLRRGDRRLALQYAMVAVNNRPGDPDAYAQVGVVLTAAGNLPLADRAFARARRLKRDNTRASAKRPGPLDARAAVGIDESSHQPEPIVR